MTNTQAGQSTPSQSSDPRRIETTSGPGLANGPPARNPRQLPRALSNRERPQASVMTEQQREQLASPPSSHSRPAHIAGAKRALSLPGEGGVSPSRSGPATLLVREADAADSRLRQLLGRASCEDRGDVDSTRPIIAVTDRPSRAALVTGAASGIGAGAARHLASLGYRLGLLDVGGDGIKRVTDELRGSGGTRSAHVPMSAMSLRCTPR